MKCPYCNKNYKDIPTHLMISDYCNSKHKETLKEHFKQVYNNFHENNPSEQT
jgi:hypothetical protein